MTKKCNGRKSSIAVNNLLKLRIKFETKQNLSATFNYVRFCQNNGEGCH